MVSHLRDARLIMPTKSEWNRRKCRRKTAELWSLVHQARTDSDRRAALEELWIYVPTLMRAFCTDVQIDHLKVEYPDYEGTQQSLF